MHYWTSEELNWLREHYKKYTIGEMLPKFNKYFNVDVNCNQIKGTLKRYNIQSGRTGQFAEGQKAWNHGMKGLQTGGDKGWFKKGNKPYNYQPVGTERVNGEGYIDVKVADPNVWKSKHRLVWEKENGTIPKGHVVIFGDGNRLNTDINNLVLVSRSQLAVLNQNGLIQSDADLTRSGVIVADIYRKINKRKKSK